MNGKKLVIHVPVEVSSEAVKAAFARKGIVPNQANARRFLDLLRLGLKVGIGDIYDEVLADKETLLMRGFTFKKEERA
ncbi:hypothetical protein [Paenibacillus sanguinis]|uniref:hypothetical protein n=1 Tax=Paenibacillus sanguinis TaxID=225906 RepID=UPI00036F6D20|nr:hypothetical protein [Paenibacillus sanguinis]